MKWTMPTFAAVAALLVQCVTVTAQANFQPRIVGGSDVDISVFPSTVAIIVNSRLDFADPLFQAQICGGTLISSTWVLTAAHCMVNENSTFLPSEISILAGTTDLKSPVTNLTAVSQVIVHQGYRGVVFGDDIALLQLAEPAPAPAIAMNTAVLTANENSFVVGWGSKTDISADGSGTFPSILQSARVPIQLATECAALPGQYRFVNAETQICAGFAQGGVDSCSGDSGGPLYNVTKDGSMRLAGITSWGDGCAIANQPGIYTDVAAYKNWIDDMIWNTSSTRIQNPSGLSDDNSLRSSGGAGSSMPFLPILLLIIGLRKYWIEKVNLRKSI